MIDVALGDYEKTTYVNGSAPGLSAQNLNKNENKTEELDNALATHLADYAHYLADTDNYQVPTISGTQIQLQKQSDTKRLFFILDADLTGGAITISLDGGTTSKPLQDIDGVAVTELSKGFVEVVADATFFTLRPRGGSNIKSIQRGTVTLTNTNSADVTVTAIDPTKSLLKVTVSGSSSSSFSAYATGEITDSTNLHFQRGPYSGTITTTIKWELIEFNNVKSRQDGTCALSPSIKTKNVAITAVDTSKSFLYQSLRGNSYGATTYSLSVMSEITSPTNLYFESFDYGVDVVWQLIEFE